MAVSDYITREDLREYDEALREKIVKTISSQVGVNNIHATAISAILEALIPLLDREGCRKLVESLE